MKALLTKLVDRAWLVGLGGMKLAMLVLVLASVTRVYTCLANGSFSRGRVFVTWTAALLVVLIPLVLLRDPVAEYLDEATSHMLSHDYRGRTLDHEPRSLGEVDYAMNGTG